MVEPLNDWEVARTTLMLPHPYERHHAEEWLATQDETFQQGRGEIYAIERREDDELVGSIDIRISRQHHAAEIGYLIYRTFWRNGYAGEAARRLVARGFTDLGMVRVHAHHFAGNEASGRVLQKCGMRFEGILRQHIERFGVRHDIVLYGILWEEYVNSVSE